MKRNDFTVPEELWMLVEPLLPAQVAKPQGGRPPLDNYRVFSGILYRLRTGCQWKALPQSLGSSSAIHERFLRWAQMGIFENVLAVVVRFYDDLKGIAWEWTSLDAAMVKAPKGGDETGRNPTDRGKIGTKRHILTDDRGTPVAVNTSAANMPDCKMLEQTLDAAPCGQEIKAKNICLDKAYDSRQIDQALRDRGIEPHTRRRGEPRTVGVTEGKPRRWKVERCNSWHNRFRGLLIRWDRKAVVYKASLHLATAAIVLQQAIGAI